MYLDFLNNRGRLIVVHMLPKANMCDCGGTFRDSLQLFPVALNALRGIVV